MTDSELEKEAVDKASPPEGPAAAPSKPHLFDRSSTHNAIFYGLIGSCALLFASDLLYHKHAHFEFEQSLGFHGLFGFAAYLAIVNSAKLLRRFVMRSEDYYDR